MTSKGKTTSLWVVLLSGIFFGILVYKLSQKLQTPSPTPSEITLNPNEHDIVFGQDTALLKIYVFANYECPHCRRFFIEEISQLEDDYLKTGKIQIRIRLIQETTNPNILQAYKTITCVQKYGNAEYLHRLLNHNPTIVHTPEFQTIVNEFIDKHQQIAECLMTNEATQYLTENKNEFQTLRLKGTPSFVFGKSIVQGFSNHSQFKQLIDFYLKKNTP